VAIATYKTVRRRQSSRRIEPVSGALAPAVRQHSTDGGSTRTQATGKRHASAFGSPSPSVCWLVGPGGLVLITTDEGLSWRRVPFPVVTDLVSVRATNDRTATVVASDGRTFVTSDGGRNWRQ
jgi:photosystem II stability/assembly factor-like uncharacterized protein